MSDLDATTPRVFLIRHGETEWTKNGRHTGATDLPLTAEGEKQVRSTGSLLVGTGKLIDPACILRIWVSPRKRAQQTFRLAFDVSEGEESEISDKATLSEDIREWDYGDYEGMLAKDVRAQRKAKGLDRDREWSVWRDGCEGGESKQQVTERLDRMISQICDTQAPYMNGDRPADVVLVAHGLSLRCFAKRWLNLPLDDPLPMMMSPGAISVLSYKNHNVEERAFFVGLSLPYQS